MYKKHGRHDKDVEPTNNDEEQFATRFFNFMINHKYIVISHVSIPQNNLDIDTGFTLNCVSSAPNNQQYPSECTVIKVTIIREGQEFEELDNPNKEEGIEKLKDAKGNHPMSM
jgi:hypothetical protein